MATREENLKKINDELEKLSDEELEQVAGGTAQETHMDIMYLNCNYRCNHVSWPDDTSSPEAVEKLTKLYQQAGIYFSPSKIYSNEYRLIEDNGIVGARINRDTAITKLADYVAQNRQLT